MHDAIELIARHGLPLVFASVFVEQIGIPIPAIPALVAAGAASANGQLSTVAVLVVAIFACLLGDLPWYWAGRHFGGAVLRILCRVSLSPDSCVEHSEAHFEQWGWGMLIFAKFIPGVSTVAPPLAGVMRLPLPSFLLLDGLGALLWAGVPIVLGYIFSSELERVFAALARAGTASVAIVLGSLAAYIVLKWRRRRSLLISLRMAGISVEQLHAAMVEGVAPLVVDVRSRMSRQLDPRRLPGAVMVDMNGIGKALDDVPLDRDMVMYCNCPNEIASARAAKTLRALGYRHVKPLIGGMDAWRAAGYAVEPLPTPSEALSRDDASVHP